MHRPPALAIRIIFAFAWLLPLLASAQTLTISSGVQTHATLTNTAVTMTGRSELHITGTSSPIAGSTIHLNSPDAWFFLTNVRPSVVNSTYLGQVRVNGANAVHGTNVRVVQYGMGTVVVPHASSFQPFQAWSGPSFTGTTASFSQYTYYNTAASLGSLNKAISSFKLKRGYMATVSTQTNGTGPSRNYVAQDGDLEVAILPTELDNAIQYIRVFPWRWVSKKGTCDTSPDTFDSQWNYNWDNNRESSLNWEYVPIRQQRWWPGYPNDKRNVTHLLGYNEPNNPVEDAYETGMGDVDAALGAWPELLWCGLRVGSPAPTDGGKGYLYDFIAKADERNIRVDVAAIHMYQCGHSASSLYNWLKEIYDRTGRPVWITEFNNGANWTGCGDPTQVQNASVIQSFIDMMENAPFVERYNIYSNVEAVRQLSDANGVTPTGVVYRDKASRIGHIQVVPETGTRGVAQLPFENHTRDTSGFGNNGLAAITPSFTAGRVGQALLLDGTNNFVQLPEGIEKSDAFSFAAWVYWDGGGNWQRIFDFGSDLLGGSGGRYMFLTPSNGTGIRFAIRNGGSEQTVTTTAPLAVGQWQHVAVTLSSGTARIYLNGTQVAAGAVTITPSQLPSQYKKYNYLGKSAFPADPLFKGRLDEVRVADHALSAAQIAALAAATNTAPQFSTSQINGGSATQGQPYTGSIAGFVTDANAGDTITYSKVTGPAWLTVAANGTLSGTPPLTEEGLPEFTIVATDSGGAMASTVLTIQLPVVIGNGTWNVDASGTWSAPGNWATSSVTSNGFPANGPGNTAFFTREIAADRTVTLDSSRTIGWLEFNDPSGLQGWTIAATNGSSLTLDPNGGSAKPGIGVVRNTAIIAAPLAGTSGFSKWGAGTLILGAANSIAGEVNLDTGSNTASQGIVRVAHPGALANATALTMSTNNSGSSTLEFDGSTGNITVSAPFTLSGRNVNVVSVRNLSGMNTLSGALSLTVGGGNYLFQSDVGTLTLGGTISAASGTRTLTFQGAGNHAVTGSIQNGGGTIALTKTGAGTLTLSGSNTHTGDTVVNDGTLVLGKGGGTGAVRGTLTINSGATVNLTATDALGWGSNTAVTQVNINGGILNNSTTGNNSYLASWTLTGGTLTSTGGGTFHINAGGGLSITSAASANTSAIDADVAIRGANAILPINVADGAAAADLLISGALTNSPYETGANGIHKAGAGALVLTGGNTYNGTTILSGGTLVVNGSINSTAPLTAATGTTLGGTGRISSPVTIKGAHAPGSSVGTQTFTGPLTYEATARLKWTLGSNSNTTGASGKVTAGAVNVTSGAMIDLVLNGMGTSVNFTDPFWAQSRSWPVITGTSISGGFSLGIISADSGGRAVTNYGTFSLQQSATAVTLVFTAYPPQERWQRVNFGTSWNDPAIAGATADADSDGLSNLLEYVLASDPNITTPSAAPQITLSDDRLAITFTRSTAATDVTLSVLGADSPDGPWTELARSTSGATFSVITSGATVNEIGTGTTRSVQVSDIYSADDPAHPRRFLRLRVGQ